MRGGRAGGFRNGAAGRSVCQSLPISWRLNEAQILSNARTVQANNSLDVSESLDGLHFSVEMETGTGKTCLLAHRV